MSPSSDPTVATGSVRERILRAAGEEFAARGLQAASVRTIARGAGVTAAMINYYFGGKEALYEAVIADAQERLHRRLGAALGTGGGTVTRLAGAYFDFLAEERQMQRILLREVLDGGAERIPKLIRPLRARLREQFGGEAALQSALSLFGAIAGYFIYAPVLGGLVGDDPLAPAALARRRRHIIELASTLEELNP